MNIPKDKIYRNTEDKLYIIDDSLLFAGYLTLVRTWGTEVLDDEQAAQTDEIDEIMADYAEKIDDLKAKYEVTGHVLNGKSAVEEPYFEELGKLQTKYRLALFTAFMDYVGDDTAIDLMLDILN